MDEDVDQEYELYKLRNKKVPYKKYIAVAFWNKYGQYINWNRDADTMPYEFDFDSTIDYEFCLSLVDERSSSFLRMWSQGYKMREIGDAYNVTKQDVSYHIKKSIEYIRSILKINV